MDGRQAAHGRAFPFPSFPRKRESIVDTAKLDPRLRGDDELKMGSSLPSFPRKRESIVDTAEVDPRLRGDDDGWMVARLRTGKAIERGGKREPNKPCRVLNLKLVDVCYWMRGTPIC